jgi:hypothetical protein
MSNFEVWYPVNEACVIAASGPLTWNGQPTDSATLQGIASLD